MLHCWASLHGFVTLEVNGNLNWHGAEVRESMFLGLVRLLVALLGLPEPADGWPKDTPGSPDPGQRNTDRRCSSSR